MIKCIHLIIAAIVFMQIGIAQEYNKTFKKNVQKGKLLSQNGNYAEALPFLDSAYSGYSEDAELCMLMGECHKNMTKPQKADFFYKKAYDLDPKISDDMFWILGDAYQKNCEFDSAIHFFSKQKQRSDSLRIANLLMSSQNYREASASEYFSNRRQISDSLQIINIEKRIRECINGRELKKNKGNWLVINLGDSVNSVYNDIAPYYSSFTDSYIFSSKRTGNIRESEHYIKPEYLEDIYFTKHENGIFRKAQNAGTILNTGTSDACVGISDNGKTMYVYADINNGDLFRSTYENGMWTEPVNFEAINTVYQETSVAVNTQEDAVFFVSNRPGTVGGKDIFYMEKSPDNTFSAAQNIGTNINTEADEDCVFLNETGDTLFFSSKGHNSVGGFDVFFSAKNAEGEWQKAQNMGFPVNTPYDDMYFFRYDTLRMYSSRKPETIGENDIYLIIKQKHINLDTVFAAQTNDLQKIADYFIIRDLLFESNQYRTSQTGMLDSLAHYLVQHSDIQIEITGYADSEGDSERNRKLSEKRASFVADYLVSKGVKAENLKVSAKGEQNPISKNTDKNGEVIKESLKYNRRVEFRTITEQSGLYIREIQVPEHYVYEKKSEESPTHTYSVFLKASKEKISLEQFNMHNISEYRFGDDYFYYCGPFADIFEADSGLKQLIARFPDAHIVKCEK